MSSIAVLHIDDEPDFLDVASEILTQQSDKLTVVPATSAAEGLDRLATRSIDCIVSDYRMPETDGIELLETVRTEYPDLPFILFTGEGSEAVASDAIAAGATDYLRKGHGTERYELLANRIENAVDQYRTNQRAAELERVRALVSSIDQALIRASSLSEIKTRVCEIISDSEPYRFAWIGEPNPETDRIEPQAWAGVEDEYLDTIVVTADDSPTGQGPAGRAVQHRRIATSQNIQADPAFEVWREEALDRDYRSSAAVPLEYNDTLYGLLCVYSSRPFAFAEDEQELLTELGNSISHAIHSLKIRNELRTERTFIDQALDSLADIFYVLDSEGNVQRCNEHFEKLAGCTDEEMTDLDVRSLFPEEEREAVSKAIEEALTTGHSTIEADFRTAEGNRVPYEFTADRLTDADGTMIGLVGTGRNIAERTRRERELQDQKEQLEQFAATVSHDLRNPLNVIQGRLGLVQAEQSSDHLDVIETATDRMERIVEDLLWLAREQQEIGSLEPVAIDAVAAAAWKLVSDPADEAELYCDCGADAQPVIKADPDQLRHLLENLFRNTIDHAGLDVTVVVGEIFGDANGFYIEDDGPGIPDEDREKVFEAGYSTSESGTGLGLNIVKRVVDAHGWEIHATESSMGGTRFEITGLEAVE
ncbi:PAS domain S-box protein [Haloarcula taiwanensis]|uniref:histidine kinase n=1 Tax=Haloarcula taiwanensis TaxID=1932004 RepID=A0A2H5A3W5_9EURY|nr:MULTISPECIES: ATP-binding protein [Haloarcula]AUG49360.1 PAS domain S-box protein [Haloarcula taiwanensis]RLM34829.1 response regulator [Haloarcula sp. Atlit-120R]RLM44243.1 response regulator [Haloarcula sp. Atlit-47R]RLM90551.1 response regulator [Haloarcula sp. Atlit-7R]